MTWFDEFERASQDDRREMLARKKADECPAFLRRMRGEPTHRPSQEHEAEAQEWLDRVRYPQPVDLDALDQTDEDGARP